MRMGYAAADVFAFRPRRTIEKNRHMGLPGLPVRIPQMQGFRESPPCTSPEILCSSLYGQLPQVIDSEGFLLPTIGKIDDRYVVSHELGRGTFGSVLKAWDSATGNNVAIKVVKRSGKATQDAVIEAAKLTLLCQSEVGRRFVVIAYTEFFFLDHFCIVFEMLGDSLHKAMERLRLQGKHIQLESLRNVSKQLCEGVQFLTQCGLVHADLKPENVVLYPDSDLDDNFPMIKLIDFGCAAWEGGPPGSVVQTCFYRAPEVTLGLSWAYPCDMWSIGCIILELFEMRRTFDTLVTSQHLALMEKVCGDFPMHMLREAASLTTVSHLLDRRTNRILWPECSGGCMGARRCAIRELRVQEALPLSLRLAGQSCFLPLHSFLQGLLTLDPSERSTPSTAVNSDWLQSNCPTPVPHHRANSLCSTPVPSSHHVDSLILDSLIQPPIQPPPHHGVDSLIQPPPHRPATPALPEVMALQPPLSSLSTLWAAALSQRSTLQQIKQNKLNKQAAAAAAWDQYTTCGAGGGLGNVKLRTHSWNGLKGFVGGGPSGVVAGPWCSNRNGGW